MDGVSVAAAIVGLVGAAANVTVCLNALVASVRTVPKLAQSVLLEVSDASKQTLTLIVTSLTCTSVGEAENAVNELKALVNQVLESNRVLAERMTNLELQRSAYGFSKAPNSMREVENQRGKSRTILPSRWALDDGGTSASSSILVPNHEEEDQDNESVVKFTQISLRSTESLAPVDSFTFERELFASRPYARAINRRPCWSAASSAVPTMGWSYLSGISLADVSNVSILTLPLSPLELWNGHRYATPRDGSQVLAGGEEKQKQSSTAPMRNTKTPLHQTAASWSFGKPSIWKSTHAYTISSANVVLLGVPSSGKRTILRRLQLLHGHNFNEVDRIQARDSIIHDLIDRSVAAWENVRLSEMGDNTMKDVEDAYWTLLSYRDKKEAEGFRLYRALLRLWAHDSLRDEIQNVSGLMPNENIRWFFEHLESLFVNMISLSDDFLLRQGREASLRSHHRQAVNIEGVFSELLDAREEHFLSTDWLSRFDNADALIFVVSLSAYCQLHPDSASTNVMQQQIRTFESLTRLKEVGDVPIILLLNQTDVLERLISIIPISEYFEDYTGGANRFHVCQFFADKFAESDQRVSGDLQIYETCAVEEGCFRGTPRCLWSRGASPNIFKPVATKRVKQEIRMDEEEIFPESCSEPKPWVPFYSDSE